jgi:hypothetical protein
LYNLKDDISEKHNLAELEHEVAERLHDKLRTWRAAVDVQMPTPKDE